MGPTDMDEWFPALLLVILVLLMALAGSSLVAPAVDLYRAIGLA